MALQIQEVKTLKELKRFVDFPNQLYKGNPYYVPSIFQDDMNTLRKDKNPAYENADARFWLATREGKIVGRVGAIHSRAHAARWNQDYLRFSWLDFIDDAEVSTALMGQVEAWAREIGMTAIHGPLGFTDMDREGMLVEGFNEMGTMATFYNHPYYPQHMERMGYAKDTDWMEYEIVVPSEPNEMIFRAAELVSKRYKLKLLEAKHKNELLPYGKELFQLLGDAYKNLYGFVPFTERQVDGYIKQYFGFIQPEFVPIVLDEDGRMVAFGITMPSLSRALQKANGKLFPFGFIHLLGAMRKADRADLYLVAVRADYQGRGVNAMLMKKMYDVFRSKGITRLESNPELETNHLVQGQWKYFEKRQHKRRRVFIKHLAAQG